MQSTSSEHNDLADSDNFYPIVGEDFPTADELLAALETSLEQFRWKPRTEPIGLDNASRDLAKRWQAIENASELPTNSDTSDHYLEDLPVNVMSQDLPTMEPEFLVAFARFLVGRLSSRLLEVQQVQHQLVKELTKLQF